MIHPSGVDLATMPCIAIAELEVTYRGVAAHASAMPERGVNALDALVIAYQAHRRAAPAHPADRAAARHHHRRRTGAEHRARSARPAASTCAPRTRSELAELKPRVEGCFRAGAEATGARSSSPGATSTTST